MVWNRVKFPNMAITFMGKNARTRLRDNQYVFRVEPNYTKHEIKEYLTKVYDLPVLKVNTMNYEGALALSLSKCTSGRLTLLYGCGHRQIQARIPWPSRVQGEGFQEGHCDDQGIDRASEWSRLQDDCVRRTHVISNPPFQLYCPVILSL